VLNARFFHPCKDGKNPALQKNTCCKDGKLWMKKMITKDGKIIVVGISLSSLGETVIGERIRAGERARVGVCDGVTISSACASGPARGIFSGSACGPAETTKSEVRGACRFIYAVHISCQGTNPFRTVEIALRKGYVQFVLLSPACR